MVVMVVDSRPYVVDGRRSRSFEGIRRNALAVVYPKDTVTNQPLAGYISDGLVAGFQKASPEVERLEVAPGAAESAVAGQCVQAGKERCVVLTLYEWQYDMFKRTLKFKYDASVKIIDRTGRTAAAKSFQAHVPLVEVTDENKYLNMLQEEYKKALQQIFNDPDIARALKPDQPEDGN